MRRLAIVWVLALFPALASHAGEPLTKKWQIDGVDREGLVYAPDSARTTPAPLVFAFHGHGGTMRNAARSFRIHELWPEAIVVYIVKFFKEHP